MYLRSADDSPSRPDRARALHFASDGQRMRSERVREIRQRLADDVYRSSDVIDEIARRILCSGDL
jgi:hypothetical protein